MSARSWVTGLALACTAVAPMHAQPGGRATRPTSIVLQGRTFDPPAGIDTALTSRARTGARDGRLHVIVQFRAGATPTERGDMTRRFNLRILGSVPENAWVVSLRRDAVPTTLPSTIRWIGLIRPNDKLGARVRARSRSATRSAAIVQFFGDVAADAQSAALSAHGVTDMRRINRINGWSVIAHPDSLIPIATEDIVSWVGAVPDAVEPDNDGVRGFTGVNADAIADGTPYSLTGNGVVIGNWDETQASDNHDGFNTNRLTVVPPVNFWARYMQHVESVLANGRYDEGEDAYIDMDDNGCVSVGDIHASAAAGRNIGDLVQPIDPDVVAPCTPMASFWTGDADSPPERYVDLNFDLRWEHGEPVYIDQNRNNRVDAAEQPCVSAACGTIGDPLTSFHNRHWHPTMLAGTMMGNGAGSDSLNPASVQWRGIATAATLRSYALCQNLDCVVQDWTASSAATYVSWLGSQYTDAGANGAVIAAHAWGSQHSAYHELASDAERYNALSQMFDEVTSGLMSDGSLSAEPRLFVVTSAGNGARPERHTEDVAVNGRYDKGEAIYLDSLGERRVTTHTAALFGSRPIGTPLVDFAVDEAHADVSPYGTYVSSEGIYKDADRSGTVSVGDVRIIALPTHPAGSTVIGTDDDVGQPLRSFRYWGTTRSANAAKNTLQLGMIATDVTAIAAMGGRGPTDDGRTKPDLVASGTEVGGDNGITTTHTRNRYRLLPGGGTSFATASAAGSATLLTEWYRASCSTSVPLADVLKPLLIHGAEDVVLADAYAGIGPDFATGYGRLRVKEAVDLVPHHVVGTMTSAMLASYTVTVGQMQQLKVTLAWNDPPALPGVGPGSHGYLQNDLDLILVAPDGTQYTPWRLDPFNPAAAAKRGIFPSGAMIAPTALDHVNNVEQVVVDNAHPGVWVVRISASLLTFPGQRFVLVGEPFPPSASPCATTPVGDVRVRDNITDNGAVPSTGLLWLSPDVWNRRQGDGQTVHENPEFGQANYFYASVRNDGAVPVIATTVELWIAEAATGLEWPSNFRSVGRITVPNLAAGEVRQVGPIQWLPPAPGVSGHYCIYMRVLSPQDPIAIAEGSNVVFNTQNSNNISWRNLQIVDLLSTRSQTFQVRNIDSTSKSIQLDVQVPAAFLAAGGEVRVSLSPQLAQRLRASQGVAREMVSLADSAGYTDAPPSLAGSAGPAPYRVLTPSASFDSFVLGPRESQQVTVTFYSSDVRDRSYDVDMVQRSGSEIIGGIRYVVRTGRR